jgi:hypothetical protein
MFDAAALDLLAAACTQWLAPAAAAASRPCRVLCLGTPRLHERLHESRSSGDGSGVVVESLLLDLDHRFAPFFGSTFVHFNMGTSCVRVRVCVRSADRMACLRGESRERTLL